MLLKIKRVQLFFLRLLLTVMIAGSCIFAVEAEGLKVDFLDVGQGLSILAECDGEVLIYDGGGRESSSYVVSYLKKQGIEKITDPETIREVQEALNGLGYECGSPDGIIGSATIAAIMAYQAENGLSKNGAVTEELVEELLGSGTDENLTETN